MLENQDAATIRFLKEHRVHLSRNRLTVYKLLKQSSTALTVGRIVNQPGIVLDRISVYRALKYFLKKGIVEEVPNSKGFARYLLAASAAANVMPVYTSGAYFTCSCCQHTEHIAATVDIDIDPTTLNSVHKLNILLEGLCSKCK